MNRASVEGRAEIDLVSTNHFFSSLVEPPGASHKSSSSARRKTRSDALLPQDQWQPVFAVSDYHYFRIAAVGQGLGCFNPFPLQQLRADSLGYNLLKIANAGGFNPLALRFLRFFLQTEIHSEGFLFGLLLGFNRALQRSRQLDIPQKHTLHRDSATPNFLHELIVDLLGNHLPLARVQRVRRMRCSRSADRGAQIRLDQDVHVSWADLLINICPRYKIGRAHV